MEKHPFPVGTPEKAGIPSSALIKFLNAIKRQRVCLHSFMILRHGEVAYEANWAPMTPTELHRMYSVSKSFVSVAVGIAQGERNVDVSVGVTVKFDVDENNHVVAERTWHDEADPEVAPTHGVFALAVHRPLENIPEEEVPLADAPQTGDEAIVFAALTLLAGISLMAMHVSEKKRKEEV